MGEVLSTMLRFKFAIAAVWCIVLAQALVPHLPIELTDSDFDGSISDGNTWLVMFYAPWCGHCKKIKPMWADLASSQKLAQVNVKVAKCDGSAGGRLSMTKWAVEYAGLSSFPSILRFKESQVWVWKGERQQALIESWGMDPSDPPLEPPTAFQKILTAANGYFTRIMKWLTVQSTAVITACSILIVILLLVLGFVIGFYWRHWHTHFWISLRWGAEGEFAQFAITPLDSGVKIIRKNRVTGEVMPDAVNDKTASSLWVRMKDGKEYWLPTVQQLDPKQPPLPSKPKGDKEE